LALKIASSWLPFTITWQRSLAKAKQRLGLAP